jgi:hypothetical protein
LVAGLARSDDKWTTPIFVAVGWGAGGVIGALTGLIDTLQAMHADHTKRE